MTWENSRQSQVLLKRYRISLLCQQCPNIWFDTLTTGFCKVGNIALLVQCDFVLKYCSGISLPNVLIALKSQFGLMRAFVNTLGLWTFQNEIQMKISNENICSLLVYVPKLSWSFSKLMFLSIIIEIRIPTIRKASFIEFFTLVLLFTRIVQFQLIPIGSCWHHLQVIYPIEQAEPVI